MNLLFFSICKEGTQSGRMAAKCLRYTWTVVLPLSGPKVAHWAAPVYQVEEFMGFHVILWANDSSLELKWVPQVSLWCGVAWQGAVTMLRAGGRAADMCTVINRSPLFKWRGLPSVPTPPPTTGLIPNMQLRTLTWANWTTHPIQGVEMCRGADWWLVRANQGKFGQ